MKQSNNRNIIISKSSKQKTQKRLSIFPEVTKELINKKFKIPEPRQIERFGLLSLDLILENCKLVLGMMNSSLFELSWFWSYNAKCPTIFPHLKL